VNLDSIRTILSIPGDARGRCAPFTSPVLFANDRQMENFADAIAYEIKRDIAERYFGGRRLIEEEIERYRQLLAETGASYSARIGRDLQRLRLLLKEEEPFRECCRLCGLNDETLRQLAPAPPGEPVADLFHRHLGHGLTRAGRYRATVFLACQTLLATIEAYRAKVAELNELHGEIKREISQFERKNDLSGILGFFRDMDGAGRWQAGALQGEIAQHSGMGLEQQLRLKAPEPVSSRLPELPEPPAVKELKYQLEPRLKSLFKRHDHELCPLLEQ
jgi:Mg2+ and Co2+ transporter CorA